jgi:hypothetical protein
MLARLNVIDMGFLERNKVFTIRILAQASIPFPYLAACFPPDIQWLSGFWHRKSPYYVLPMLCLATLCPAAPRQIVPNNAM